MKDIEDDFDPDKHDAMMQKQFGEDFYEGEEMEKPVFSDDDDDYDEEDWDAWQGRKDPQRGFGKLKKID